MPSKRDWKSLCDRSARIRRLRQKWANTADKEMIYTSRLEPFGFTPLEASACGTPVVAIAEGGVRETVFHGKNSLLVLSANPRELAFAMQRVLDEPGLARQMAEEGPRYVQSEWNLDVTIDSNQSDEYRDN
jgi:glycosyltransferase involved in cell wall biosynthesis